MKDRHFVPLGFDSVLTSNLKQKKLAQCMKTPTHLGTAINYWRASYQSEIRGGFRVTNPLIISPLGNTFALHSKNVQDNVVPSQDILGNMVSALGGGPPIDTIYDEKGSGVSHDAGLPALRCGGCKLPLSQYPFKEKAT